jgi:hypothetical protein
LKNGSTGLGWTVFRLPIEKLIIDWLASNKKADQLRPGKD